MSFSRWWTEGTAALGDRIPLPLALALLVVAAALVAVAWYTFPAWVPRRLPRLRMPRLRLPRLRFRLPRFRRRRRPARKTAPAAVPAPSAPAPREAPDAPAVAYLSLADRLAAEGRYAEAVRERLRDMIGELVSRQVVPRQPGLTVLEVGATAARNRPPTGPPLAAAGAIFSELWYAQRPASAEHDRRMRELATELHRVLAAAPPPEPAVSGPVPAAAPPPAAAGPPAVAVDAPPTATGAPRVAVDAPRVTADAPPAGVREESP